MFKEAYTCISGRAENAYLVDYWGEGFCTCRKIAHVERLLFEIEKNERQLVQKKNSEQDRPGEC